MTAPEKDYPRTVVNVINVALWLGLPQGLIALGVVYGRWLLP